MVAMDRLVGRRSSGMTAGRSPSGTHRLRQAAALPWRLGNSGIEIMLITSRRRGRWILPKGWPEGNERLCDAAAREAFEEAGLSGSVSMHEFGRYDYLKAAPHGALACQVSVFPLQVIEISDRWKEYGQRERQWMGASEAAASVAEPELRALIAAFFDAAARA